jgi:hypothetical protein
VAIYSESTFGYGDTPPYTSAPAFVDIGGGAAGALTGTGGTAGSAGSVGTFYQGELPDFLDARRGTMFTFR